MESIDGPRIERWVSRPTCGLRRLVPFRGMLAERDRLLRELVGIVEREGVDISGPFFLRLHTVDMAGQMDIEVGVFVADGSRAGADLTAGEAAAGDYATFTYRDHSMRANRQLHEWIASHGLVPDVEPSAEGDRWAGRFEIYVTDPRAEPRKTRWITQLAFLIRPA